MTQVAPVPGDRTLPPGFAHPHASEEARRIAEEGLILRVQVGSGVHSTAVSGQDDRDEVGAELVAGAHRFVSRLAAERFVGYLDSQRAAMTGETGAHTNRPELVAIHGYDTKFAMHALRLGVQGVELLGTGRITLPVPSSDRELLLAVRRGELPLSDVVGAIDDVRSRLVGMSRASDLPDQPDRAWVDAWLHRSHLDYWAR